MAELVGTAVGAISLGIQVCQGLVEYYGSWKDAPKDVARMCQSIRSLEEMLNAVHAAVKDNAIASQAESGVQSGIDSCTTSIAELQSQLIKVQEINGPNIWSKVHGQGRRLLYPFRESTLLKLNGIVAEMRENLSFALDVLQLQTAESSTEKLDYMSTQVNSLSAFIQSHHDDQESTAIINWLSPLNFFVAQNDILRRRQVGTGEWLFETPEFEAWLAGTDRILWCSGQPGAGKTILASSIVNKLQIQQSSRDVGLAFAYCNYKEHDIQTLANLIGSLVQQLVQCHGSIPDEIRVLYTQYSSRNTRPSEDEFSRALLSLIGKFSHVYLVVDALDECNPKTRSRFIEKLQELPTNLRLLCTSRHLGDIQEAFADAAHLEIQASDSDVALYVEAQILQVPKLVKFCKKAGDLQGTIVEKLVMKAKGMFLLAELHLESLKTKTDIKSLRKALDVLPDKLEKTYDDALERIQRQPEDESKLAMRVLSWITHAVRPLKVEEIQHAIAVTNFDPDDTTLDEEGLPDEAELITVCGGSAVIDQDSGVIRLVHYTTQDYFERHRSKIFPTAQADILCACIRYLSLDPFGNGPCATDSDLRKRQARFRLLEYASCNWENHVCGELDDTVEERAIQFLNDKSLLSNAIQVRSIEFLENISTLSTEIQARWVYAHLYRGFWGDKLRKGVPGITIAAEFGFTRLVDKMLKQGNSINESGIQGKTALHEAARNGHEATVELLLERGANTEAKDENGRTALSWAVQDGYEAILQLLLNKGANIDAKAHNGMTALLWAAESGLEAIVQLLLENGADMEATSPNGYTALLVAGSEGYVSMVQLLLQNGANTEVKDIFGRPLLFLAAHNGHKAVVHLLLEEGFDMKEQDRDAILLMFSAAMDGDEAAVRLLLEKNSDMKEQDGDAILLMFSRAVDGDEADVRLLLEKGASVVARDRIEMTGLLLAASKGHAAIVQLLLERGVDARKNPTVVSAMMIKAASEGWETIVRLMLDNGADVNAKNQQGMAALLLAIKKEAIPVVQLLLEGGANVEVKDPNGNTALVYAAQLGNGAIVQLLLEKGADVEVEDQYGNTALFWATKLGRKAVTQLLLGEGIPTVEEKDASRMVASWGGFEHGG